MSTYVALAMPVELCRCADLVLLIKLYIFIYHSMCWTCVLFTTLTDSPSSTTEIQVDESDITETGVGMWMFRLLWNSVNESVSGYIFTVTPPPVSLSSVNCTVNNTADTTTCLVDNATNTIEIELWENVRYTFTFAAQNCDGSLTGDETDSCILAESKCMYFNFKSSGSSGYIGVKFFECLVTLLQQASPHLVVQTALCLCIYLHICICIFHMSSLFQFRRRLVKILKVACTSSHKHTENVDEANHCPCSTQSLAHDTRGKRGHSAEMKGKFALSD